MFTLTSVPGRKLIRIHLFGMLTLQQVAALAEAEQATARALVRGGGGFDLLVEVSGADFQTQAVMQVIEDLLLTTRLKADRVAIVRSSAAARMQARRLAKVRPGVGLFDDVEAATAWLGAPEQTAAA